MTLFVVTSRANFPSRKQVRVAAASSVEHSPSTFEEGMWGTKARFVVALDHPTLLLFVSISLQFILGATYVCCRWPRAVWPSWLLSQPTVSIVSLQQYRLFHHACRHVGFLQRTFIGICCQEKDGAALSLPSIPRRSGAGGAGSVLLVSIVACRLFDGGQHTGRLVLRSQNFDASNFVEKTPPNTLTCMW